MRCVLAIDSGGTKCDAALVGEDGRLIGWGHCDHDDPASGRGRVGSGRTAETISKAIRLAIRNIVCEEMYVVAFGRHTPLELVRQQVSARLQFHSVLECDAALALAGRESGVVVLAGTGAFVYGRTRDRRDLWLDGLGPLIGDYGSAYHIGLAGVRAAAKSTWHPRHQTSLAEAIPNACRAMWNGNGPFSLTWFVLGSKDRAEIASLAKIVDAEARKGDQIAKRIIRDAAAALAETLGDLVDRLDIANEDYTMIGTGGVITNCRMYWRHLCSRALRFAPRLKPELASLPLVFGMALIGLSELGADPEYSRHNLFQSARQVLEAVT